MYASTSNIGRPTTDSTTNLRGSGGSIRQTNGGLGNVTPRTPQRTGFAFLRSCAAAAGNLFSKHEHLGETVLNLAITALICTVVAILSLSWEILLVSLPILVITGSLILLSVLNGILSCFNPSYLPQQ